MLTRVLASLLVTATLSGPIFAQTSGASDPANQEIRQEAQVEALFNALGLSEMIDIMREEGLAYGAEIAADLLPGRPTGDWDAALATIYDADRMQSEVLEDLGLALANEDIAPILVFFEAEPGATIINLEVTARRALLDDAVEAASKDAAIIARMDETPRYQLIDRFVTVNDLVETNVVGAMNSNYAFYIGLKQGGAFPADLTEDQILSDVWSQESEIRDNTTEWVYSFLLLAYSPLSDADLETYIAFSETPAGAAMNRAIFQAFDGMFEDVSRALGLAAAREMVTQEL